MKRRRLSNPPLVLRPHGKLNGAGMYVSEDGRWFVVSEMHTNVRRQRYRAWTAYDTTQREGSGYRSVVHATSLKVPKERLDKYVAAL